MNFLDGSLFPENQQPLIITAAPYAPSWVPSDFPEDIAVTMPEQIQKAVDCYNAGATVLHLHVRELDGRGSKRLSKFNELIAGVRHAAPDMLIQVGGSISFAPDIAGTSMEHPEVFNAYKEMTVPAQPGWVEEHIRRLSAAGIQSAFQCYNINSFESVERLMRRGIYKGPLVMNWVAISGGMDAPNIYNMANFVRATPDGAVLTVESSMRNVLPVNMTGIAMGLHVRCGTEDNLWTQDHKSKMSTVHQVEQLVRISREFGRPIATGRQAREISKIGVFYDSVEETLAQNGFAPNPRHGHQGYLRKAA